MEYVTMAGGAVGGDGSFDVTDFAESWPYILGAVLVMFAAMAFFLQWQNR